MDRMNKRIVIAGMVLLVFSLLAGAFISLPGGEAVFREQRCDTCHRFRGQGGLTGPDLTEVSKRRGTLWIMNQIKNPRSHNPDSRMPAYDNLGYIEIFAIISYLKS
jgi:cbb3-type cytochrome oxidase cytochrome c subunit